MVLLGDAPTRTLCWVFSVKKTELISMARVTARQQIRRNAHLVHLAKEAIEATYGDPTKISALQFLANPVLPAVSPKPRWRGRKLSD